MFSLNRGNNPMNKVILLFAMLLCVSQGFSEPVTKQTVKVRSGWSQSGAVTFRLHETCYARLYHVEGKPFAYEGTPENEKPYYEKLLKPGKHVITVQGYYYLELTKK